MAQVAASSSVAPGAAFDPFSDVYQGDSGGGNAAAMEHRGLAVSSKGNVTATFRVPGEISVPSDGAAHNVTVTELELDAVMSWVCVPKKDAKTHLKVGNPLICFVVLWSEIGRRLRL